MAGLLDFLDTDQGRVGLGLLAAAGPTMQPMSFGQRLAGAMQGLREERVGEADRRLRQQLVEAQLSNYRGAEQSRQFEQAQKLAEAQRQQQQERRMLEFRSGLLGVTPQEALAGGGGPTNAAAARVGQGLDEQQLLERVRAGVAAGLIKADDAKALIESQNWGRQKVARTAETVDAQGRPVSLQLDEFGQPVGEGMRQWKAPLQVSQGDRTSFVDPVSLDTRGQFMVNMSPSERDASARGWAAHQVAQGNLAIAQQRLGHDMRDGGKVPVGYRWAADGASLEPIPGGPAAVPPKGSPQAQQQASARLLPILDQAEALLPKATGSYIGAGADMLGQAFGASTAGAKASAQLKALEGAIMMAQPRMEGPQSDKDTMLYRQMAGQIGDSTVPVGTRQAALQVIRELHQKYAGVEPQKPAPAAAIAPSQGAINALKMDPRRRHEFDAKYGPGEAAKVLGN